MEHQGTGDVWAAKAGTVGQKRSCATCKRGRWQVMLQTAIAGDNNLRHQLYADPSIMDAPDWIERLVAGGSEIMELRRDPGRRLACTRCEFTRQKTGVDHTRWKELKEGSE